MRYLILGGAAVYRCDKQPVFSNGFSRCGQDADRAGVFPQPASDSVSGAMNTLCLWARV